MRLKMAKKKSGRPASAIPFASFQVRIPENLNAALERARVANRRTKAEELRIALERYLGSEGFLEPPNGKATGNHPS